MTLVKQAQEAFLEDLAQDEERSLALWEEHISTIGIEEKQLPIGQASKDEIMKIRLGMFFDASDAMAEQVYTGEISIGQWQEHMKQSIRELHTSMAATGKGGWDAMTPADWGRLGPRLKDQYRWLQGFADKISDERETISLKQIKARARLYGEAAPGSAIIIEAGTVLELLLPWMPRDGSTPCLNRCHCRWVNVITGTEGRFNIVQSTWLLGVADHCETCLGRDGQVEINRVFDTIEIPETIGGF